MGEGIKGPGDDLLHGHGHGIGGVQDSEAVERAPESGFQLLLLVGDDRAVVHLCAGAEGGDHSSHGNEFRRLLVIGIL